MAFIHISSPKMKTPSPAVSFLKIEKCDRFLEHQVGFQVLSRDVWVMKKVVWPSLAS